MKVPLYVEEDTVLLEDAGVPKKEDYVARDEDRLVPPGLEVWVVVELVRLEDERK